jgi:hypothetical protein
MKSHEPSSRIRVDQIRTEKIFQQTNWAQMELKTIDAPIIVSTRTGLFDGQDQVHRKTRRRIGRQNRLPRRG